MKNLNTVVCLLALIAWSAAAAADTGGPGKGGYEWIDSDEADVTYEWIDVSATAASIPLGDDQQSAAVDIGFSFSFYGEVFEQVRIGSNGFLSFQSNDQSGGFAGQCPLPMVGGPDLAIYGFYQDLDPSEDTSGPIYFDTIGETPNQMFVATWDAVEVFQKEGSESDPVTFQIVLYEGSNEARVNIQESGELAGMPVWTDNTTVGIEGPGGAAGVGLCPGLLPDEYAVRFSESDDWGLFPAEGNLVAPAGEVATFDLEVLNFGGANLDAAIEVASDAGWDVAADPAAVTVSAGGGAVSFQMSVTPDAGAALGTADTVTVTVTAGGETRTGTIAVVAAYPSDKWQALAPLPEAIRYAELVSDGDALYVIGGMLLNGDTQKWEPVAEVLRWDPDTNGWDDAAAADLPTPAAAGRACFMDGRIYYAGGYDGPAEDGEHWSFQPDLLVYDVAADTWESKGPLPVKTSQTTVACHGAKVYVVNGIQDLDDNGALVTAAQGGADGTEPRLQIYDAAGDSWSEGAPPPGGASAAAAAVLDGVLVLAGGTFDNPDDPTTSLVTRATLLYDITDDAWNEDAPVLSAFRSDMGAALYEDTLCVVGGIGSEGVIDTWECFAGESWVVQVDLLPVARFALGATEMDGFIYVAGGHDGDGLLDQAVRWPEGDLGDPTQPEPVPDTGGDPDVVAQPDTPGPGEDILIPGEDTPIPGDDTAVGDLGGDAGGGTSGGTSGGGCSAGGAAVPGLIPLLLALLLCLAVLRRQRIHS